MKRMSVLLLVSIFVLAAWAVQAEVVVSDQPTTQAVSEKEIPDGVDGGASSVCVFCFTCGGAYPLFSGGIPTAAGSMPIEFAGGCDGALIARADTFPFLCCSF